MFSLPPCFKLILTLCYYFYGFLRELDLAFSRSPDRDEALPFHGQTRWVKFKDLALDIHDAMELWALGPHVILVKVISVCGLHVFFHQYEVALRVHSQLLVRRRTGQLRTQTYCYYTPAQFVAHPQLGLAFLTAPLGQRGPSENVADLRERKSETF